MCYILIDDFSFLGSKPLKLDVINRLDNRVRCLLGCINHLPSLKDLQAVRVRKTGIRSRTKVPFNLSYKHIIRYHPPKAKRCVHWYSYTTGFSASGQFNLGMYSNFIRIGLGFSIEYARGKIDAQNHGIHVEKSFNLFKQYMLNNSASFIQEMTDLLSNIKAIVPDASIGIEYKNLDVEASSHSQIPLLLNFIRDLQADGSNNVFLHPTYGENTWFFVGVILPPENYWWPCQNSMATMSDNNKIVPLLDIIETTFSKLRPYLEASLK